MIAEPMPLAIVELREEATALARIIRGESDRFIDGIIRRESIERELRDPDRPLRVIESARREYLYSELVRIATARARQEQAIAEGQDRLRPMLARLDRLEDAWARERDRRR